MRVGTGHAELTEWAEEWLERIAEVFRLDGERRELWQPERSLEEQSAEFGRVQRQLEAAVAGLFEQAGKEGLERWLEWEVLHLDPQRDGAAVARVNAQGRVLGSLLGHREGLERFVGDPRIPMENNLAERMLRGPVIARYTSFGSGGPAGARAAGLLFGVCATLRLAGLNPYTFVLDYLRACARNGGRAPENLDPWLPWRMSAQRRAELSRGPVSWWADADGPDWAGEAGAEEAEEALPQAA